MRFIKTATATAAILSLTLLATGCAPAEDAEEVGRSAQATASSTPSASTSSSTTPASSSPATTAPALPATAENECLGEMRAGIVAQAWVLVEASRGASDQDEMVEGFYESVEGAYDANEMSDGPCRGNVELAELQFNASLLQAVVGISGDEAEESYYADIVDTGNAWFEAVESDNVMGES